MRTGSEVVRSPGKTGSDRRTVRTTRLTHCSHSEAFTGLGCCLGIWPSSEREVDRDLGIEVWYRSIYCTGCDPQLECQMAIYIGRRKFIAALGGATVA